MKSIELFAGAGGLALGTESAGFKHEAVVELNRNACDTIKRNTELGSIDWPLFPGDVAEFGFSHYRDVDLVSGGPPCQPFSIGGKHRGHTDKRNLFPEVVRAVRETQPRAVLVENVKGLLRPGFAKFFEYVLLQISYPDLVQKDGEDWVEHLSRLEQYQTNGSKDGLYYKPVFRCLNAADYGVPQKRERVFIVAFRGDVITEPGFSFPNPTHSKAELLRSKWITGEYWDRHKVATHSRPKRPANVQCLLSLGDDVQPWRTVRDAISDLPDPRKPNDVANHKHNPGARVYGGHTGSPLDEPAKTLKAGDHGVPGGENMLAHPNGTVRYFSVRESARLQTFPDDYVFEGSWTETMRQLGNAVAVNVASQVASRIRETLERQPMERRQHVGGK
ncbi:MAG: DNA cytosine methyltransferase [Candidatus Paceibacterota bacterium]